MFSIVKNHIFVKIFQILVNINYMFIKNMDLSKRISQTNQAKMRNILIILFLLMSISVNGRIRWVSPRGNDNNTGADSSSTGAWLTWQKAFISAQPGDTVYFREGIYPTTSSTNSGVGYDSRYSGNNGTKINPICYFNYPGENPVLDCQLGDGNVNPKGLRFQFLEYVHFRGLTVKNVRQTPGDYAATGFNLVRSNNVLIENCVAHNIGGIGFGIEDNDTVYLRNCDAYNLCDSLSGNPGGNGDGFQITNLNTKSQTAAVFLYGCRAFNVSDDGYGNYFEGYIEWDHCWAFNNGYNDGEIGDGNGFKHSRATLTSLPISRKLKNCISAKNHGVWGGYVDNSNGFQSLNSQIINCVDYGSNFGFTLLGYGIGSWSGGNIYRNNIAYANEVSQYYDAYGAYKWVHDYNSWDHPSDLELTEADFISLDWTELQQPRKADGSLPDINFMKLAQGSDLIDAGTDVGLPFSGSAPDLGWSESSSTSAIPAIPVYVSSVIQNTTPSRLELTYNLSLANIVPGVSAFAIKVNNVTRSVNTVAISGSKVLLTLASPVIYGDVVTVAYTKPASNPLQTASGGVAASITAQNVTNNVAAINNQPPVVSISSPTKSTGFIAPAAITIDANASDPDGSITKVEFYNGTSKLGEITSAPYSYTWKEVPAGTYSITAAATDNKGLKTVSAAVTVVVEKSATTVNQLPSVSVKIPNEKKPKKHDNVVIVAEASDPDGTINKVELKNGDVTIAEMTTAPYVFTLQNVDTGTYVITAIATDNLGAVSISDALELRIEDFYNPDLISLYPNPNRGFFKIDILEELPAQECTLSVISLTGATVYQDIVKPGETFKEIERFDLQSGQYVLMLTSGKTILTTKKFIKQ